MKPDLLSVTLTAKVIAVKEMGRMSPSLMMERRVKMRTAAPSTAPPPLLQPIRRKENTVTAATANSLDMEG